MKSLLVLAACSLLALNATAKESRKPASNCPKVYPADTSFEKAFEAQKADIEKNGVKFTDCSLIVKEALNPEAKEYMQSGRENVSTPGIRTTSIYACKGEYGTNKYKAYFRIARFLPTEKASYDGFNATMSRDCVSAGGEFVSSVMTSY